MRKIERISIGSADRERLEQLVRDRNTPQKVVWRARIVLLATDGLTAGAIAAAVGKSLLTVRRWRRRQWPRGRRASQGRDPAVARQAAAARDDQASGGHDAARETAECDPMERSQYRGGGRHLLAQRPADLGFARAEAASRQDVQDLARQELRCQGRGCGRALSRSPGQSARSLRR